MGDVDQVQTEETENQTPPEPPAGEEPPPEETETQAKDGEETEPPEGEEGKEEQSKPEDKPEEKHKRAGGWARKIERLERQNQILLEQLGQRGGQPPPAAQPGKEKTPDEKAVEYIDNLVEQRLAARDNQRQQQTVQAEFQRRTAEVRAAHPDFDDVVMAVDAPVSPALQQALLTSEHGPAIMYQLAKNPAELARLSALPPLDAAREIGRLEARASPTAAPKTTPKSATRPPAPPTNVNGSTSSTRSLDDLPLADYKRAYRSGRR